MTRRRAILETIKRRLEAIRTRSGFSTDAGEVVFLNEAPALGEDDPPVAIVILVGDETPTWQNARLLLTLPIEVQVVAKADVDAPWMAVEDVIGDVKRAIELEDRRLARLLYHDLERGQVRTLEREPGSEYVGASIMYLAPYMEAWGDPGTVRG
jgi:hypothetical protein